MNKVAINLNQYHATRLQQTSIFIVDQSNYSIVGLLMNHLVFKR